MIRATRIPPEILVLIRPVDLRLLRGCVGNEKPTPSPVCGSSGQPDKERVIRRAPRPPRQESGVDAIRLTQGAI
ncbi:MAG TPA: hypothetical protein VGB89_16785 [Bacteroidota bacterium]